MTRPDERGQLAQGDATHALDIALARLKPFLKRVAYRLSDGDFDLQQELVQAAAILLWEMDPARFDDDDVRYVGTVLHQRMRNAAREQADLAERGRRRGRSRTRDSRRRGRWSRRDHMTGRFTGRQ